VAVDSAGDVYVADYYHHVVDVYSAGHSYLTQLPLPRTNGPCGLAVDPAGHLYVDSYHEAVTRYTPGSFPPGPGTTYGGATVIDSAHPTGVAVDPASGDLYVDERTAVEVFDPTGAPLRRIELLPGADAYGVAAFAAAGSEGDVYVADAASDEILVYGSAGTLLSRISGAGDPRGGFPALADAALAVDQSSGDLILAEDIRPDFEAPAAAIEEFDAEGHYLGEVARPGGPIVDAIPSGLATTAAGGLYVGSGNGSGAEVLAFGLAGSEPLLAGAVHAAVDPGGAGPVGSAAPQVLTAQKAAAGLEVIATGRTLRVLAPEPGRLTVTGPRLRTLSSEIGSGALVLRPRLGRRGVRALPRRVPPLAVDSLLRFEPDAGGPPLDAHARLIFGRALDERKR
jgi:DNA-binding beta-propeller fold protein YncE